MRSAPGSAATGEVFERRIRSVYEALDNRSYKNALKLCDGLLDKYKDNQLVKALCAMSLARLGRQAEAGKLCDEVLEAGPPMDEHAINIFKLVLKELQRPTDITRIYEMVHKDDPTDLDTMASLFYAYARELLFVKQQQMAVKLLKQSGGQERFQWWIILSLMMQVRSASQQQQHDQSSTASNGTSSTPSVSDNARALQLLQLAESMATRQANKASRVEGFEALLIWIDLLLARGQAPAALAVLEGPVGSSVLMQGQERSALHVDLLALCGHADRAAEMLVTRLKENPDDWAALCGYLDCVLPTTAAQPVLHTSYLLWLEGGLAQRMAPKTPPSISNPGSASATEAQGNGGGDAAVAAARQLLDELCVAAGPLTSRGAPGADVSRRCMRGPYLAKVELAARLLIIEQQQQPQQQSDAITSAHHALAEAILEYLVTAGHLVSCAADLRAYTRLLPTSEASWLYDQLDLQGLLALEQDSSDFVLDTLRRRVCAQQLCGDLQLPVLSDDGATLRHALQLMGLYKASQLVYKGLDDRERGPVDEIPTLAAATLVQAAMRQQPQDIHRAVKLMTTALVTLEAAVTNRPYAPAMRLALTALHLLLGSPSRAAAHQAALEIKNIQLDSVAGHHLLPALLSYHTGVGTGSVGEAKGPATAVTLGSTTSAVQRLLRDTLQLFSDHQKNGGDTLDMAYKHGTYSKVLESIAFRERLESSHTRAVARVEAVICALRTATATTINSGSNSVGSGLGVVMGTALTSALTAHPLPWDHLPSGSNYPLRFNEDLATRPGWYPPTPGPACLAPAAWWKEQGKHADKARGQITWWCSPSAAESACEESKALRVSKGNAVRARWCMVHGLLHVLGGLRVCDVSGVLGLAPDVLTVLDALSQALGRSSAMPIKDWLGGHVSSTPHSDTLDTLIPVVACSVLAAGAALAADGTSDHDNAVDMLVLAVQLVQQACECLYQVLRQASDMVLVPGSWLACACTLVAEPVTWLVMTMEVLAGGRASGKQKGKKTTSASSSSGGVVGASAGGSDDVSQMLAASGPVSTVVNGLVDVLARLDAVMTALINRQVSLSDMHISIEGVDTESLWSWQHASGFDSNAMVHQLVTSQKDILSGVQGCTTQLLARVSKVNKA